MRSVAEVRGRIIEKTIEVLNQIEREGLVRRYGIGGAVAVLFHAEPVLT